MKKKKLGRHRYRWQYNKVGLKEIGHYAVGRIYLNQKTDQRHSIQPGDCLTKTVNLAAKFFNLSIASVIIKM